MKKGYVVIEACEDYEQVLCLETGDNKPKDGILCWPDEGFDRHIFTDKKQARAAINRTYHYAKAFEYTNMPEKTYCLIKQVSFSEI